MPKTPRQHPIDKSLLPVQRLHVRGDRGVTVEPVKRAATANKPVLVVKTEWRVATDSSRRARLLAAIFGDDSRGA